MRYCGGMNVYCMGKWCTSFRDQFQNMVINLQDGPKDSCEDPFLHYASVDLYIQYDTENNLPPPILGYKSCGSHLRRSCSFVWPLEEASFSSAWRTLFQHGKRQKPSVNSHVHDLGSGSSNPVKPWLTPGLQHHEWSWAIKPNSVSHSFLAHWISPLQASLTLSDEQLSARKWRMLSQ